MFVNDKDQAIHRLFVYGFRAVLCLLIVALEQHSPMSPVMAAVGKSILTPVRQTMQQHQEIVIGETHPGGSQIVIRHSDGHNSLEIKASGVLAFTDDDADIKSISQDGYFFVKESRDGKVRTLEVLPGSDGQPRRFYSVQGEARTFDREARSWLAEILPIVIRNSGLDAAARVQRILKHAGINGVLKEVSLIGSDAVKRIYFEQLLRTNPADVSTLHRIMRQIGREIASDGEKANLLIEEADLYLDQAANAPALFEAIGTISPDGERSRVLSALLKRKNLTRENTLLVLGSSKTISSDGEKANLLIAHIDWFLSDTAFLLSFFESVNTIGSDGEHAQVLSAVLKRRDLRQDFLLHTFKSAETISSDGEKANLLVGAARLYLNNEAALVALYNAARTIASDGERDRVMSILAQRGLTKGS